MFYSPAKHIEKEGRGPRTVERRSADLRGLGTDGHLLVKKHSPWRPSSCTRWHQTPQNEVLRGPQPPGSVAASLIAAWALHSGLESLALEEVDHQEPQNLPGTEEEPWSPTPWDFQWCRGWRSTRRDSGTCAVARRSSVGHEPQRPSECPGPPPCLAVRMRGTGGC